MYADKEASEIDCVETTSDKYFLTFNPFMSGGKERS